MGEREGEREGERHGWKKEGAQEGRAIGDRVCRPKRGRGRGRTLTRVLSRATLFHFHPRALQGKAESPITAAYRPPAMKSICRRFGISGRS